MPDQVVVIDFASVRCLDFSCADEIVGKLLLQHGEARYFLLRGVTEIHGEAIEAVLERYNIAVVAQQRCGTIRVLGPASDTARRKPSRSSSGRDPFVSAKSRCNSPFRMTTPKKR